MIQSLTGFGRAEVESEGVRFSVEIRSVNNRFLEVYTKLPRNLVHAEMDIRSYLRKHIERGKVNVFVYESKESYRKSKMEFDSNTALELVTSLKDVAEKTGVKDDLSLSDLVHLLDYISGEENEDMAATRLKLVKKGLESALSEYNRMRTDEGKNLEKDFRDRLNTILDVVSKIEEKSGENREASLQKLRDRIEKYIAQDEVDPGRLEQEVAYIIDKLDVTEEIVRLRSHIQLFNDALDKGGAVGKRLNFILQEMNRETNTIGSKASDASVASWVVQVKEELEKIREQVQNIV